MKTAIWLPGEEPDTSFIPPMQKRRLSSLQKGAFYLAHAAGAEESKPGIVFCSKYGEFKLSHRLVADFNGGDGVSPQRFSTSVHNAAPGLYSIFSKNTASYTAIAADDATIECGLLEAVRCGKSMLWLYAEEHECGFGAAIMFEPGDTLKISSGDPARPLLTFEDIRRFITGESDQLAGRFITIQKQ